MAYKIKIIEEVEYKEQRLVYEKTADTGNVQDNGCVYGYVKAPEKTYTKDVDVLEQRVEKLDLVAVLRAINGIKRGRGKGKG